LALAVRDLLADVAWQPREIDLIAVTQGPGSFTGLRAGVTMAKTLGYATQARVQGVNTLAAIADQSTPKAKRVWAVLDAQRRQLFVALFDNSQTSSPRELQPTRISNRDAWLEQLRNGDVVSGAGLESLQAQLPAETIVSPADTWPPTALTVARLGLDRYQSHGPDELWKLVPTYYRKSAAEEKLESP
jgi:tRNA threonylcarbamoyladenosine biosynthesis protein TsaB